MELLGFYDEPYSVRSPRRPGRLRNQVVLTSTQPVAAAADSTSRVMTLWETTELNESALEWWKPQLVARRRLGGRRIRMSSLIGVAAIAVLIAAAMWWVVSGADERAAESVGAVRSDAGALAQAIPVLSRAVSALDDPDPPELAETSAATLEADSAARALFSGAGALEVDAEALRNTAVSSASAVLDTAARVNRLMAYRLATERLLVPPDLPVQPSSTELSEVAEIVSNWRGEIEVSVDELSASVLADHHAQLTEWVAGMDTWQVAYLDGVRQGDAAATSRGVDQLQRELAELQEELLAELSAAGGELVSVLAGASEDLDRLLGN